MQADHEIRKAKPTDAAGLKLCMQAAYAGYQQRMGGLRLPPMDVDYAAEIENYPSWVVASAGNIIAGLIMSLDDNRATIANIAVDPEYQGLGIGGELMKFAESTASANGFSELYLATHLLLDENVSLYRHLGWQQTGRDETRVYLRKTL